MEGSQSSIELSSQDPKVSFCCCSLLKISKKGDVTPYRVDLTRQALSKFLRSTPGLNPQSPSQENDSPCLSPSPWARCTLIVSLRGVDDALEGKSAFAGSFSGTGGPIMSHARAVLLQRL